MTNSWFAISVGMSGSGRSLKYALRVLLMQLSKKPRDVMSSEGSVCVCVCVCACARACVCVCVAREGVSVEVVWIIRTAWFLP